MTTTDRSAATAEPVPEPERKPALHRVGAFVESRIAPLQKGYIADRSEAVRKLAQLRRGAGRPIEDVPELWGLSGGAELYPDLRVIEGGRLPEEVAAHIALTLYALHQQSRREKGMHKAGRDLGGAVRRLMPGNEIDEPLRKRFVQVGSATSTDTLAFRLREIVVLLRRDSVPLDYGLLADQLHFAQRPEGMAEVRLAWGRGFNAYRAKAAPSDTPSAETPESLDTPEQDT